MRVLLFSKYGSLGASSRLRSYQYLPYLSQKGFQVDISALFDNHYLEGFFSARKRNPFEIIRYYLKRGQWISKIQSYDMIWIEYELFPWLPATIENLIIRKHIPLIVDYDDAVFHRFDLSSNRLVRKLLGQKFDHIMRSASAVIVGNQYIADRATSAGASSVVKIPTVVDLSKYRYTAKQKSTVFTIGWIGTPHTAQYLRMIEPALKRIAAKYRIQFIGVGTGNLKIDGVPTESLKWSKINEAKTLSSFDVGIMPLRDEPFERGKCGYKLIQYMACGLPVVASPVGANTEIVEHGRNGFLSSFKDQWIKAIEYLIRNPDKAQKMGKEGRRKVENSYCTQITAPKLFEVFRSVVRCRF